MTNRIKLHTTPLLGDVWIVPDNQDQNAILRGLALVMQHTPVETGERLVASYNLLRTFPLSKIKGGNVELIELEKERDQLRAVNSTLEQTAEKAEADAQLNWQQLLEERAVIAVRDQELADARALLAERGRRMLLSAEAGTDEAGILKMAANVAFAAACNGMSVTIETVGSIQRITVKPVEGAKS